MMNRVLIAITLLLSSLVARGQLFPQHDFSYGPIALLQPEWQLSERIGGDAAGLANYMKALTSVLEAKALSEPQQRGVSGVLVVAVRPNRRVRVWVEFGDIPDPPEQISGLKPKLEEIEPPPVFGGVVIFLINFDLWGGGATKLTSNENPVYIPKEWMQSIKDRQEPIDTETLVNLVWPDEA